LQHDAADELVRELIRPHSGPTDSRVCDALEIIWERVYEDNDVPAIPSDEWKKLGFQVRTARM
jgi:hypothetical protein